MGNVIYLFIIVTILLLIRPTAFHHFQKNVSQLQINLLNLLRNIPFMHAFLTLIR